MVRGVRGLLHADRVRPTAPDSSPSPALQEPAAKSGAEAAFAPLQPVQEGVLPQPTDEPAGPIGGLAVAPSSEDAADLELGSRPTDPLIAEVVALNPTSVRLRNAIGIAAAAGDLPLQHVSQYLAAGEGAPALFMRHVRNLGHKSAVELDRLLHRVRPIEQDFPGASLDNTQLREALCALFCDVTVRQALRVFEVPLRLWSAFERAEYADTPLSRLLVAYPRLVPELLRMPNIGRTSLAAGRHFLGVVVRAEFEAAGLGPALAAKAEALILDDVAPEPGIRRELSRLLGDGLSRRSVDDGETEAEAVGRGHDAVPPPVEACLRAALVQLDPRSLAVVEERYGLAAGPGLTLEQIGQAHGVTRERIRQLEAKALQRMRRLTDGVLIKSLVAHGGSAWTMLARGEGHVAAAELTDRIGALPPWFALGLELSELTPGQWLDRIAQPYEGGWVAADMPVEDLRELRPELEARLALVPLPFHLAGLTPAYRQRQARAILGLTGWHLFGNYVLRDPPRRRVRRALGLHAILAAAGEVVHLLDLCDRYVDHFPPDPCTIRDAEIVLEMHRHLFIEVQEGWWAAIGPGDAIVRIASDEAGAAEPAGESAAGAGDVDDQQTIAQALADELARVGPMRISELIERAPTFLPPGRSVNSVGPTLIVQKVRFTRILPGFYALREQVPTAGDLLTGTPAFLLQEDQVRLYALARRAGEPWGAYPLWTPEVERLWCIWARDHASRDLFESLLSVARPQDWPATPDREEWGRLASAALPFSIHYQPHPDALVLPDIDRILAAGLHILRHSTFSWISGNRVQLRRASEHMSVGLLAALVGLGILDGDAADWQSPHRQGPRLREWVDRLDEICRTRVDPAWDDDIGRCLIGEILAARPATGWATADVLRRLCARTGLMDAPAAG
ncbi:hypothetical protein STHU_48070 [Allostella humosa]|uniref:sigma factor-like helix-turn-helix DNA-binding protein n=1 Tax=Stella humosa TaxID=94 RepID=UPI00113EEA0C|nr:sigma factor-like helix-turn-helix DNA-binding protein [Stella humosa]BBK34173.1 hypothetical protein STHU_48070 [Stella humosa]